MLSIKYWSFNFIFFLSGPLFHYRNLVEQGRLQHDPYQERVTLALENLLGRLERYEKDMEEYHDGMQREIFLKFVDKLEEHCEIILIGSEIDYRLLVAQRSVDKVINQAGGKVTSNIVPVMFGKTLEVPESCRCCRFYCCCKNHHTVFISDIPVMSIRVHDKARRFITFLMSYTTIIASYFVQQPLLLMIYFKELKRVHFFYLER
ncbi:hypothetical protein CRYUN_Cryun02cG0058600 [Craigia yunnanensis]